jgi:hypothetical protein
LKWSFVSDEIKKPRLAIEPKPHIHWVASSSANAAAQQMSLTNAIENRTPDTANGQYFDLASFSRLPHSRAPSGALMLLN